MIGRNTQIKSGRIAHTFAKALSGCEDAELYAFVSRTAFDCETERIIFHGSYVDEMSPRLSESIISNAHIQNGITLSNMILLRYHNGIFASSDYL